MKSIIVYTKELKAQNLYPKRIISPPAPNKCCPARMEVLGRPRLDEQGRRFYYKRCKVCGFALRHFLDPVGTILTPVPGDPKAKKPTPPTLAPAVTPPSPVSSGASGLKGRRPAPVHASPTRSEGTVRKGAANRHARPARGPLPSHRREAGRKSAARRRR